MTDFTWNPDKDLTVERAIESAVREVQFGDGVVQLQRLTLKPPARKFSLTFTNTADVIDTIDEFLAAHTGKRFVWVRHNNERVKVRCKSVSRKVTGITDVLSCEFMEELY